MSNWKVYLDTLSTPRRYHIDRVESGDRVIVEGSSWPAEQLASRVCTLLEADEARIPAEARMSTKRFIGMQFAAGILGITLFCGFMLLTGFGQDIPGTDGLTRSQLAEMLVECDGDKPEGTCVVDVNLRLSKESAHE